MIMRANYFQYSQDPTRTNETTEGELVQIAAQAYITNALSLAKAKWGERLTKIPRTIKESKHHMKRK